MALGPAPILMTDKGVFDLVPGTWSLTPENRRRLRIPSPILVRDQESGVRYSGRGFFLTPDS
jgi:hypothetical protein